jgi:twitching motility protein PilT
VLIEQPIEYLHKSNRWSMTQREVGSDTDSFEAGVRAAILQDADAIVIGGLEQPAVIEAAFRAVEAGRLVIGRMAAADASAAIRNLLQRMESDDQQSARLRVAEALHAVVAQKLIPRQSGGRRVLATQLLYMTPYVRETILDAGTADNLGDALVKGRDQYGTQTFDQSLADLVLAGEVAFDMAVKLAANPLDLELQLRGRR